MRALYNRLTSANVSSYANNQHLIVSGVAWHPSLDVSRSVGSAGKCDALRRRGAVRQQNNSWDRKNGLHGLRRFGGRRPTLGNGPAAEQ